MGILRRFAALTGALLAAMPAQACDMPVCLTDYATLGLARIITFDTLPASPGPGRPHDEVLVLPGARFGERFAGQLRFSDGDFDRISGTALAPLTAISGGKGETLGIKRMYETSVLHGHGPQKFPARAAIGEGAIAVLFDHNQSALGFRLRGGEDGFAEIIFLRRDGSLIATLTLGPLREQRFGFARQGDISDIAGFVLVNSDPEGVAMDDLVFDKFEQLSRIRLEPHIATF